MSGKWWDRGVPDEPKREPATQAQTTAITRLRRVCERAVEAGMTDAQRVAARVQGFDAFLSTMSKRSASVLLARAVDIKKRIEAGQDEALQWADL